MFKYIINIGFFKWRIWASFSPQEDQGSISNILVIQQINREAQNNRTSTDEM